MSERKISIYKTMAVTERMDVDTKGRFQRVIEAVAETVSGIEYTVTMPKLGFTKEAFDALLTKEAQELEKVRQLQK